jgi:hypothetical protein
MPDEGRQSVNVLGALLLGAGIVAGVVVLLILTGVLRLGPGAVPVAQSTVAPSHAAPDAPTAAPVGDLTFFEQELVGSWSRFHSDGSHQYLILRADRTACKWEENAGGSIQKQADYGMWSIDESRGQDNGFPIVIPDAGLEHWFDYANDTVYWGGQSSLDMSRDSDVVACFES